MSELLKPDPPLFVHDGDSLGMADEPIHTPCKMTTDGSTSCVRWREKSSPCSRLTLFKKCPYDGLSERVRLQVDGTSNLIHLVDQKLWARCPTLVRRRSDPVLVPDMADGRNMIRTHKSDPRGKDLAEAVKSENETSLRDDLSLKLEVRRNRVRGEEVVRVISVRRGRMNLVSLQISRVRRKKVDGPLLDEKNSVLEADLQDLKLLFGRRRASSRVGTDRDGATGSKQPCLLV